MHIKYIKAKNFLSIGNEAIEIDFTKLGKIVNIKGDNRDQGPGASNGAGKSTIIEVIVYTIFGKLIKNLNHKQAMNIKASKGLETEIHFDHEGHEYKIIRRRKPDELELWKDGVDESKGGIPATQDEILKEIKLNYTAFINVVCFGQHNTSQFLICDPAQKRAIAENLLSLDMYNKYCKTAKDKLKDMNDRLKFLASVYEKSLQDVAAEERQVKQLLKQQDEWKAAQLNGIERLKSQREKVKNEIARLSAATPDNNYEKLQAINEQIELEKEKKAKATNGAREAEEKIIQVREGSQSHNLALKEAQYAITKTQREIEETQNHSETLLSQKGAKCQVCFGIIDPANFQDVIKHNKKHVEELKSQLAEYQNNKLVYESKKKKLDDFLARLKQAYEELRSQEIAHNKTLKDLESRKTIITSAFRQEANTGTLLLEQQIENLSEQIDNKQKELEEGDPYGSVIEDSKLHLEKSKNKCNDFKDEIANLDKQVPYLDFWIKAFGDTGIRSFVIGEIIPILNARINYWLQFLVDNKIQLKFNTELEEKIERNPPDGDPFVYNAMSGGEHQRIDLGIALAFAQVMMLTAGTIPSLVCLDEVGTNLDRPGIQAVYATICELARERQVLVTTHDPDLLEMLAGYDVIQVVKENGYTRLEK